MKRRIITHYKSFGHAWRGLTEAVINHQNFHVHIILSILALAGAYYFNFSKTEIILVIFTIIIGFAAEMINTSLEAMTDLITKEWREEARIAKDISAGMMLVVAVGAFIVAAIIFIPHIYSAFVN